MKINNEDNECAVQKIIEKFGNVQSTGFVNSWLMTYRHRLMAGFHMIRAKITTEKVE